MGNGIKTNRMEPKKNVDLTLIPLVIQGSNQKPHSFKQGSLQIMSLFFLTKNPVIFLRSFDYFIFSLGNHVIVLEELFSLEITKMQNLI